MTKSSLKGWRVSAIAFSGLVLLATSAAAAVNVRVQPSGNTIATSYTLINEQRTFFGRVEGATSYSCQWEIDGLPQGGAFAPSNVRYITIDHTFASSGSHNLRLTCNDPADPTDTDTGTIQVTVLTADSLNRQKNSAIDNGLRYAYQRQVTSGGSAGCFYGSGTWGASTGMALLAFEQHGHTLDSPDEDVYRQTVSDGLQCLYNYSYSRTMTDQSCIGDPEAGDGDADADDLGIYVYSGNMYYPPFALMALVNSGTLATGQATSYTGGAASGMSLYDMAIDLKDHSAWAMTDLYSCAYNGWRYGENYGSVDNSVSQWPALAMLEARKRWGIDVNPAVKTQLKQYLDVSQDGAGGICYSGCGSGNYARTGAGVIGWNFSGEPMTYVRVQNALAWLAARYSTSGGDTHWGNFYAMYAFYKAMKLYGIADFPTVGNKWEEDYADYLANQRQFWHATYKASYFRGTYNHWDQDFDTYVGLAMLAPEVSGLPPVADAGGPYGPVVAGQPIAMSGSGSFHQDPAKHIVKYEWDYNAADGLWWNTKPAPGAGEGAVGINVTHAGYPDLGVNADYTVTLRVTDDGAPVATDVDTTVVQVTTGNAPPTARTNGPWAGVPSTDPVCVPTDPTAVNNPACHPITFDASASSDPNAGPPLNDSIVLYQWDIDGDGVFSELNGDDGWPQDPQGIVVKKLYNTPTSGLATLRVTDSFGLQGTAHNQILAVAFVYATNYSNCYTQRIARFTEQRGLLVHFSNIGDTDAQNVVMTLTDTPANVLAVKAVADLGTLAAGDTEPSDCGGTLATSEIVINVNLRVPPTGGWNWQAEFDVNGTHYIIPNLPPTAP